MPAGEVKTLKGTDALGKAMGLNETKKKQQQHQQQRRVRLNEVKLVAKVKTKGASKPLQCASFPGKPTLGLRDRGLTNWTELHPQRHL